MLFEFSDEHEELRRTVRDFLEQESDEARVREHGLHHPEWLTARLGRFPRYSESTIDLGGSQTEGSVSY